MPKARKSREFSFALFVNGVQACTGDETTISIIFGNLDGVNFAHRARQGDKIFDKALMRQNLETYLPTMAHFFKLEIKMALPIETRDPEGNVLLRGAVGSALDRVNPLEFDQESED